MAKEENLFKHAAERSLPSSLFWVTQPFKWIFDRDLRLCIVASPQTNLYNPVGLGTNIQPIESACFLASKRAGDFTLTTRVSGLFANIGDAASLLVWSSSEKWAKLCLERVSAHDYGIVTVVTKLYSDGAHGEQLKTSDCFLKISRRGNEFAMHYSHNGDRWKLARYFCFENCPDEILIGACAQAPQATGCTIYYSFLNLAKEAPRGFPAAT